MELNQHRMKAGLDKRMNAREGVVISMVDELWEGVKGAEVVNLELMGMNMRTGREK